MRLQFKLLSPINFAAFNTRCLRSRRATEGSGGEQHLWTAMMLLSWENMKVNENLCFVHKFACGRGKNEVGRGETKSVSLHWTLVNWKISFLWKLCGCEGGRKVLSKWINIAGEKKGCRGRRSFREVFPFRSDFGTGKVNFQSIRQLFIYEAIRRL